MRSFILAVFVFTNISLFAFLPLAAQDRGLQIVARSVGGSDLQIGKQYAVLIGIDRYAEWASLRNPVKDAKAIKEILARRYYIDEFVELYDAEATASGIRRLFDDLIERVGPTDSVLIYYAGHGYTDKYNTGFWIPSDGSRDLMSQDRWIGNGQIRNFMTMIRARSLALVSDSCFSGDLINVQRGATPTIDSEYWRNALRYTAKQVLTSGASESVPDESEFARQLKSLLESNTEACLDPLAMYDRIRRGVTQTLPLLGTLPGHESGASYVLFLKGSGAAASTAALKPRTTFALTVDVSQKDTDVYVNGEWKGQTPLELSLQPGAIEVGLSGPFVRPWSTKAAGKAGEGIRLAPKLPALGAISLDAASLPSELVVMLDGVEVEASRLVGGLPTEPGTRTLRIEGPLYRTWETAVSVKAEELSLVKPELVFKTASIRMPGLPPDATVSVAGQGFAKSGSAGEPALFRDLRLGDYAVTISHPLWSSAWSAKLNLADEKEYELDAPTGWIELPRPPSGALVSLNGKRIKTMTQGEREATLPLLAGRYRLEVSGTYLKSSQSDLVVEAGRPSVAALRYEEIGFLDLSGNPGLEVAILGTGAPSLPSRLGEGLRLALPGGSYAVKAKRGEDIDWPWSTSISVLPGSKVSYRIPPQAETWSTAWRIREEEASLASFKTDFDTSSARRKSRTTIGIAALATGGLSGAAAGIFYFLGSQAMSAYQSSTSTSDALAQRKTADLYSTLFLASASLSGAGLGIGGLAFATVPSTAAIERRVSESLERLVKLRSGKAFAKVEN